MEQKIRRLSVVLLRRRTEAAGGRISLLLVAAASLLCAEPRVDNVLVRMTPPGATTLVGVHIDQIAQTDLYKKLAAGQLFPQLDLFAKESGFDPRRDVKEVLYATTAAGSVLMARGTFHVTSASPSGVTRLRHGDYEIWRRGVDGFCVLDPTLALAGDVPVIEAALDEWKSGSHTAAQPLLARVTSVNPQTQMWGVSTGSAGFLADNLPRSNSGLDFSHIFQGLQDTWFEADLAAGLRAEAHGATKTEQDAVNLRNAVRGMVGLGRLQVPENHSELLRAWDGITAEQQGRSITLRVDIEKDLADKLIEMINSLSPGGRGLKRTLR